MDFENIDMIYRILGIFLMLFTLVLVITSLVIAVYCQKHKISPVAGWLMVIGWSGSFLVNIAYFLRQNLLSMLEFDVYSWVTHALDLIEIGFFIVIGLALVLFRPPKIALASGKEGSHV